MSPLDRIKLAALGTWHAVLGASKIAAASAATIATDGLAAPILVYGVPNGVGNMTMGATEISGAIIGDESLMDPIEEFSGSVTAVTTVTGLGTLARGGNLAAAARNARIELLFTGGFTGGLKGEMEPYEIVEAAENTADLVKPRNKSLKKCACK